MTTEQKDKLLELVAKEADQHINEEMSFWNEIYWEIVKLDTDEQLSTGR